MRLLILSLLLGAATAMWPESWIISEACHSSAQFKFDDCNPQDIACLCKSKNYLATVALCISQHANKSASMRDQAWDRFTYSVCEIHDAALSDKDFQDSMEYLDGTAVGTARTDTAAHWQPVKIPKRQYRLTYRSVYNNLKQKDVSTWQGSFLVGYWVIIMVMAMIGRFLRYMAIRFSHRRASMSRPSKWQRWIHRRILLPASFGYKHMMRVKFLGAYFMIPTRFESLVILVYFILNIVFMVAPYDFLPMDVLYPTHWIAMMRFVSDRSGIIATIQIPLLTLFALRNNIMIWLTGWNYTTFNTYHRAIARVSYLQMIVHAITKHVFAKSFGASLVQFFYPVPLYRYGVAAMFLMVLMFISGSFRVNHYELFLRLHIAAAIGSFIMIIFHLNGLGYKQPMYVAFGLWCGDWLIRLGRIVFVNFSILLAPTAGSGRTTFVQVCLLGTDIVNVKIRTPVRWIFKPGQYAFIHVSRLRFWEAHPFSIVSPSPDGEAFQMMIKQRGGMTKRFVKRLRDRGANAKTPITMRVFIEGPYGIHCPVERYDNIMLIAGGVGVTGVIPYVEWLAKKQEPHSPHIHFLWAVQLNTEAEMIADKLDRLSIENRVQITIYAMKNENEMVPMGYLQAHADEKEAIAAAAEEVTSIASSELSIDAVDVNAVREQHFENAHFRKIALSSDMTLGEHSSSGAGPSAANAATATTTTTTTTHHQDMGPRFNAPINKFSHVTTGSTWRDEIKPGRPPLSPMIEELFRKSDGSVCVLGCGPPPMMDCMRDAVCQHYELAEHGRVDYFEEAYSW